jgi:iron complex outermembrane receptor protein
MDATLSTDSFEQFGWGRKNMKWTGRKKLFAGSAVLALCYCPAAFAQTAGPDEKPVDTASVPANAQDSSGGKDIVVTGSRIARRDYSSDSPIVTVGAADIAKTGTVNVESALNKLPQFIPSGGSFSYGYGTLGSLNLRGLGANRNLVLLDGRRLPASGADGTVTTNIIPMAILEDVEVITGGASAVYGSDAISGVVNFKTLRNFNGVLVDAQYGNATRENGVDPNYGDSTQKGMSSKSLSIAAGVTGDHGHALLALSYFEQAGLVGYQRNPFYLYTGASGYLSTGAFVPAAGNLPTRAAIDAQFSNISAGTVSLTSSLGFNNDGSLFAQTGSYNLKTSGYLNVLGNVRESSSSTQYIASPQTRYSVFAKADYDLGGVTVYGQALYVHDKVTGGGGYSVNLASSPNSPTVTIPVTNPFIPAALQSVLASRPNPTAPFNFTVRLSGLPYRNYTIDTNTVQIVAGLRGKLPFGDWTWDVYGSHSIVDSEGTTSNYVRISRLNTLLNAPDGGASTCAGGLNIFGRANNDAVSAVCSKYLTGTSASITKLTMDIAEGTATGSLFELPAGPVKAAVTVGYRREKVSFIPDPIAQDGDMYVVAAPGFVNGGTSVKEAAIELAVPLLANVTLIKSLEIDLGYRYSDYNLAGGVSTYKASGLWKVFKGLSLRAGYEHAVRAPNLIELYANGATGSGNPVIGLPPNAGDPCDFRGAARAGASGAQISALCVATGVPASFISSFQYITNNVPVLSSGSKNIGPEKADTFTAGLVFQPSRHLSLSVDYYNIKVKDVISILSATDVLNKCYNLDGSNPNYSPTNLYCQSILRDTSNGNVRSITLTRANFGGLKTSGIDIQLQASVAADDLGLPAGLGALSLRTQVGILSSYATQQTAGGAFVQRRGTIDISNFRPLPNWQSFTSFDYTVGPVGIGLDWRHIPKMRDISSVTTPAAALPATRSYDTFDLNANWKINSKLTFRAGVNNLFDRDANLVAGALGQTLPGTYDVVGRRYFVGFKAKL